MLHILQEIKKKHKKKRNESCKKTIRTSQNGKYMKWNKYTGSHWQQIRYCLDIAEERLVKLNTTMEVIQNEVHRRKHTEKNWSQWPVG